LISADRAEYSASNPLASGYAGVKSKPYTVVFPHRTSQGPAFTSADYPQGDGYATGTVSTAGIVTLSGKLADNTSITVSAPLSKDLEWPLFAQLYSLKGSLAGMVKLNEAEADSDMASTAPGLLWFRPYLPGQWYPYGWTEGVRVDLIGAKYTPAPATVFADLGAANPATGNTDLVFTGGLLTSSVTRFVNLTTTNVLSRAPAADASFTFTPAFTTGFIKGTFTHTDGTKPAWQGVLLQKGANRGGFGYFMSTQPKVITGLGESGRMTWLAK